VAELKEIKIKYSLEGVDGEDFGEVLGLAPPEDRKEIAAPMHESLGEAFCWAGVSKTFAVASSDEIVGYLGVGAGHDGRYNDGSTKARVIRMPLIDTKHQGKGFEKAALRLGIDYLLQNPQNSGVEGIFTDIDLKDALAVDLLKSFGFEDSVDEDGDESMRLLPKANGGTGMAQGGVSLKEFRVKVFLEGPSGESLNRCLDLVAEDVPNTFVATNQQSIGGAIMKPEAARPFAIFNGDEMVGFIMFDINFAGYMEFRKNPENKAVYFWRFMIDQKHQGKGYGRAALKLGLDWVKETVRPDEIWTSEMPDNKIAAELYKSFGFEFTGDLDDDELVMLLKLK